MAWLAVDKDGGEVIYNMYPERGQFVFDPECYRISIDLPDGTIEKIIGRKLTWEDEPVEIK